MQVKKIKGIQFPLGYQFVLAFEDKEEEDVKSLLSELMCAQDCIAKGDEEFILRQFNVSIFNSIWNIWSVNISSNRATFTFRDAKFQNIFILLIPIVIFLAHLFMFKNFTWVKAISTSLISFFIFTLFFYLGRNFVSWRICRRFKSAVDSRKDL